jgi:hypothetical protein
MNGSNKGFIYFVGKLLNRQLFRSFDTGLEKCIKMDLEEFGCKNIDCLWICLWALILAVWNCITSGLSLLRRELPWLHVHSIHIFRQPPTVRGFILRNLDCDSAMMVMQL